MTDETKETRSSADGGDGQEQSSPAMQQIVDMGSSVVKNRHGTVHCLTIVGQVEGHMVLPNNTKSTKYEHVLPLLASLEESDDVDGLLLLLNTVGGDIEAGLAIAELVAGMRLPTVTLRRPLHRRAAGGVRQGDVHRLQRVHDHPPGAHVRHGHRRAGDVPLL